jgi:hypothetical protein
MERIMSILIILIAIFGVTTSCQNNNSATDSGYPKANVQCGNQACVK